MEQKKVVVYSGGLDSTVLLHDAVEEYGKNNVVAITFDYGSKHNAKEIECALWQAKELGLKHIIFHLESIGEHFKSTLLKDGGKIPYGHYAAENMKDTVVPLRNGIMLMIASGYADSINADKVMIASHSGDHAIYLDCKPAFNKAINSIVRYGTDNRVSISAPFNKMYKWDIVKKGKELGVDFLRTWSCYEGKEVPCWECGTCNERIEAFEKAGVKDPLMKAKVIKAKGTKAKKYKPKTDWTYNVGVETRKKGYIAIRRAIIRLMKKGVQTTQKNIVNSTRFFVNRDGSWKKRAFREIMRYYKDKFIVEKAGRVNVYFLEGHKPNLNKWLKH